MKKICIMEIPAFAANTFAASTGFGGWRINKTNNSYDINYFITDHLGSTRAIVNANGSILEQKDYYPFGKEHENANLISSTNRWNFSGKEKQTISDLGWLDFSARMYANCEMPIFTTQDPLAEKYYSISPYAYCANNPLRFIDPNGMDWYSYEEKYKDENDEEQTRIQYKYVRGTMTDEEMKKGGYSQYKKAGKFLIDAKNAGENHVKQKILNFWNW